MNVAIDNILADDSLSTEVKIERVTRQIADLRSRAQDPAVPLESQDGHALVEAELALRRLRAGT